MRQWTRTTIPVFAAAAALGITWCSSATNPGDADGGGSNWVVDAGGDVVDAGEPDAGRKDPQAFLGECVVDGDCVSGLCLPSKVCSKGCIDSSGCPAGGWHCDPRGQDERVCVCNPTASNEKCDGVDNDCDGTVDEAATCEGAQKCVEGACVCPAENTCGSDCSDKQTDPNHCGSCEKACKFNELCSAGACNCPGKSCDGRCTIVDFDSNNCGDCGRRCGAFEECLNSNCVAVDHEWAAWQPSPSPQFTSVPAGTKDGVTGLTWSAELSAQAVSWSEAADFCKSLDAAGVPQPGQNNGLWRLPTRIELTTIIDYSRDAPALDPSVFPNALAAAVWTSTPYAGNAAMAWGVNFDDGSVGVFPKEPIAGDACSDGADGGTPVDCSFPFRCVEGACRLYFAYARCVQ